MGLETVNYIEDLNASWPEGSEYISESDNHVRNLKKAIKQSFPNTNGAWSTTNKIKAGTPDGSVASELVTVEYLNNFNPIMPIGVPFIWMLDALPDADHFDLEGQAISRASYPALFALYGTKYGAGNGTTTFNLPDARGMFMRVRANGSTNDPDRAARTRRDNGSGDTTGNLHIGDNVGTKQLDAIKSHTHAIKTLSTSATGSRFGWSSTGDNVAGAVTDATGGNETRPINFYIRLIVRGK